jgi:hypothetical protein
MLAVPLPKRRRVRIPAFLIADRLGFKRQEPMTKEQKIHYGRKALLGQYVKSYMRQGHLPEGIVVENGAVVDRNAGPRVSRGALKRYNRDHGTEGKLDFAESINARR